VKLTDTQRRLLAAASQRDDRALERPSNLTGGVAGKAVAKLLADGRIEGGSIPRLVAGVGSQWGECAHTAHHQARASGDPGRRGGRD
jgi:hypothetical protein